MSDDWATEEGVTCVVCPDCAFAFDAIHTDTLPNTGYSCPACAESRLRAELDRHEIDYNEVIVLAAQRDEARAENERLQQQRDAVESIAEGNGYATWEITQRALRRALGGTDD